MNTSSWGGAVLQDENSTFHMFASELVNHCGIDAWVSNSRIIHATSDDLEGPYERIQEVWRVFSHEPEVIYDSQKDQYVMVFTADCRAEDEICVCENGSTGERIPSF